jgi:hypothetical protein
MAPTNSSNSILALTTDTEVIPIIFKPCKYLEFETEYRMDYGITI